MLGCLSGMTTPSIMLNARRRSFHLEPLIRMDESAAWLCAVITPRMELLVSRPGSAASTRR